VLLPESDGSADSMANVYLTAPRRGSGGCGFRLDIRLWGSSFHVGADFWCGRGEGEGLIRVRHSLRRLPFGMVYS
jgi:hypothetical protein